MRSLPLARPGERLAMLCLGAHADDIEIGAGATILDLIAGGVRLDVHWVVLSAEGERAEEAAASARAFLAGAARAEIEVASFRDGYFPFQGATIKEFLHTLAQRVAPDIVLAHHRGDAHQDHRLIGELIPTIFRNHLTLCYEIPKWDGDLGQPNIYAPVSAGAVGRKIELLGTHFASQRAKDWFDPDTFRGLARLRGMECRAPERFAEAFHASKLVLSAR